MESHFPSVGSAYSELARERVLADLRALTIDSELLLKATANDVSEKAGEVRAQLAATVERAKATIADLQARGIASARAAAAKTDTAIRAHPYESIAIALGVGVLLGIFLNRDRG